MTSRADAPPTNGIWAPDEDSLPYLSAHVVDRPPIKLLLSLVGRCNLRCFHCLGTSLELVRASQDSKSASRELVDFVVDRVLPDVRAIRLGGVGLTEQLTSRTFDYFMERAGDRDPHIGSFELITNLSVMTERRADLLAGALTDVQVSIEGVEDNFTRLRGLPWPRLVKHVQMLRAAKARNPASRMKISFLACAMSDMLDDLLRFDLFQSLGIDSIIVRELNPIAPEHEDRVLYRDPARTRAFIREFHRRALETGIEPIVTIADRYDPDGPAVLPQDGPPLDLPAREGRPALRRCTLPFEVVTVIHTGQFGVCCYVTDLAGPASTLSSLSIMDVWNSPGFVGLRKTVNSDAPPAVCLGCEVKVGHLGETDKALLRTESRVRELEAERDGLRAEAQALRGHVEAIEADRAARLDVIHQQGRQLGELEGERNTLRAEVTALHDHMQAAEADRAARLDVIHQQGRQLGELEGERNTLRAEVDALHGHMQAIEADRAARLDVIHQQGRRLDEQREEIRGMAGREEALAAELTALGARLAALEELIAALRRTRAYRLLRRLGRWEFAEQRLAELRDDPDRDPPSPDR